jgi:hypothetical protein
MSAASYDAALDINFDLNMRGFSSKFAGAVLTEDRRRDRSRARLKTGQLYFDDLEKRCGCLIVSRSANGALIEVDTDGALPHKLRLISAALEVNKLCEVISREGRKILLRFGT